VADPARATTHYRKAVDLLRPSRDATLLPVALIGQASVLARRDPANALRVAAAAVAIRARVGGEFPPFYRGRLDRVRTAGEAALGRTLAELRDMLAAAPVTPEIALVVVGAFLLGSLLFLPLDLLVLCVAIALGPWAGAGLAAVGAAVASAAGYAVGRALGPQRLCRLIGARAYRIVRELQGRGTISVAVLRLVPVTTSATIHFASGAARVPLRAYFLGTALGLAPWIVALCALGGLVRRLLLDPGPKTAALTVLLALGLCLLVLRSRWSILRGRARREHEERAVHG